MQKMLAQVDTETGEILNDGVLVYVPRRTQIKESWFMAFQDPLMKIAQDNSITKHDFRVLIYMMSRIDFENYIHVSQADAARALSIAPSHVSAAVSRLTGKGYLVRGPKSGRNSTFKLSSSVGWKGKAKNLSRERTNRLRVIAGGKSKSGC